MSLSRIKLMAIERKYETPSAAEKTFNRVFGFAAGLGLGPSYIYLLEVRGRKSGKLYSTAVSLLALKDKKFLVAPRGRTQWVRNAEASGEITLKKRTRSKFQLRPVQDSDKPEILKSYLSSYPGAVQRFFPIRPEAPLGEFQKIASGYPVFELIPA